MHALGVVLEHCRFVAGNLPQAGEADFTKGVAGRHLASKRNSRKLHRRAVHIIEKPVAALRFACQCELRWQRARDEPRDLEQLRLVAASKLQLDLAQPHRRYARLDRADVERELDNRAVALERKHRPAHRVSNCGLSLRRNLPGKRGSSAVPRARAKSGSSSPISLSHSLRARMLKSRVALIVWVWRSPTRRMRSVSPCRRSLCVSVSK